MSNQQHTLECATRGEPLARAWQTAVIALLGAFIVLGVGFAGLPQLHNAAHDTRHTLNFPCH